MSIADFPSYAQMRLFVYHYFDNFHPVFSFLRKSSFAHDASQSWVLLLAVAAVGAKYSTSQHDRSRADPLLRCLSVILHQKHYGNEPNDNPAYNAQSCGDANAVPRAPPDLRLVQAAVLNLMCLMNSGKSAYVHRALMERHYLTDACATLQLLSGNNRIFDIRSSTLQWLEQESRIRTGLIIWVSQPLVVYKP